VASRNSEIVVIFVIQIYIQRTEGCDHMTCSRCNTEFCYRCGERRFRLKLFGYVLEDHDMKHSIIGCNEKYKPEQPVQRALTRGSIFGEFSFYPMRSITMNHLTSFVGDFCIVRYMALLKICFK